MGKRPPDGTDALHLRILATSDLHAHVRPYDYFRDHRDVRIGLARAATLAGRLRRSADASLLVDNGDFLSGSPLGDVTPDDLDDRPHPVIAAMNRAGYDVANLGNHEFNGGVDFLLKSLGAARFPVISTNARFLGNSAGRFLTPHVMIERALTDRSGTRRILRIGVIGFLPPQTVIWDRHVLQGRIGTSDIVDCARAILPVLRRDGADIVLALSHSGIGAARHEPGQENASAALAALEGIDAVVTGHAHQVFPSPDFADHPQADIAQGLLCGKPAVMPGSHGSHLGVIDLWLEHVGAEWRVSRGRGAVITMAGHHAGPDSAVSSHRGVLRATAAAHAHTLARMRTEIAQTPLPLVTDFALVADVAAQRLVAAAQADHVRRLVQGTPDETLPVLAATAVFKAGGRGGPGNFTRIPTGPVRRHHVADLYPFLNAIRAIRLTGAEITEWLEQAVSIYRQVRPGLPDQPLIDTDFASYNFDMIAGLSYTIDPTVPPRYGARGNLRDPKARRICNLRFAGGPVDPGAVFVVATNSYRLATWDWLATDPGRIVALPGDHAVQGLLADWLHRDGLPETVAEPGWHLRLPPDISVTIDTSPLADPRALQAPYIRAERIGTTSAGFARVRLRAAPDVPTG